MSASHASQSTNKPYRYYLLADGRDETIEAVRQAIGRENAILYYPADDSASSNGSSHYVVSYIDQGELRQKNNKIIKSSTGSIIPIQILDGQAFTEFKIVNDKPQAVSAELECDWSSELFGEVPDVQQIILSHLDEPTETTSAASAADAAQQAESAYQYQSRLSFMGNITEQVTQQAAKIARLVLDADPLDKIEKLVEKNPAVLFMVVETTDSGGNKVKGTLLQLAALNGDFNLPKKTTRTESKAEERDNGMVERLHQLVTKHISAEAANTQFRAVRPPGWEKETAARMQQYKTAIENFANAIIHLKTTATDSNTLKIECASIIETFKNALKPNPAQVITSGYIFDMQVIADAITLFESKVSQFGGWYSDKSDLFWIVGIGSLQACASGIDKKVLKKGIYNVVEDGVLPDRSLKLTGACSYLSLPGSSGTHSLLLAADFFLDIFGREVGPRAAWVRAGAVWRGAGHGRRWPLLFRTYVEQKHLRSKTYAATWQSIGSDLRDKVKVRSNS